MKNLLICVRVLIFTVVICSSAGAQTLQLKGRAGFGSHGDGSVRVGDFFWLQNVAGAGGSLRRGMAYNSVSNHLYIPHRTSSPVLEGIHILDATTGTEIFPGLNTSGITNGGTIVFIKMTVAEDGAIYGMNFGSFSSSAEASPASLTTWTTIYRWADENSVPTLAFAGDPANGRGNLQWGYGLDVRGSGTNTQILIISSSANTRNAAILTTADGANFTSTFIDVTNAPLGSLGPFSAASWGAGNTFWAKGTTNTLQQISFTLPPRPISYLPGGGTNASTNVFNTGATANSIPIFYNFYTVPDRMRVYYENALIFDSGLVGGSATTNITYAGSSTLMTITMNEEGNSDPRTNFWNYSVGSTNVIQANVIQSYGANKIPTTIVPFKVQPASNLLAGVDISTPDSVILVDIANAANPSILSVTNFPTDNANQFQMGSVIFGSNAVFAFDCNNGIMALDIVPSTDLVPPYVTFSPVTRYVVLPTNAVLSALVGGSPPLSLQWQVARFASNTVTPFENIPGATNDTLVLTNTKASDEGFYHLIVSNAAGQVTSADAQLLVFPDTTGIVTPLFSLAPVSRPYITADAAATPFQRSIGYNALSNQVIIISRTNANTLAGISINVLDGTTGADLYQLKTNGLASGAAAGAISLLSIAVADDGAVYAANEVNTAAATGNNAYRIYRWADSGSNTTFTTVFSGQPAGDTTRWGDTMHIRGSGTNTQIIIDAINNTAPNPNTFAAVLAPSNGVMTTWISLSNGFSQAYSTVGGIGRSLQFGPTNTFWQKKKNDRLALSSYDLTNRTSTEITNFNSFPTNVGPVAIDLSRHLAAGIYFSSIEPYVNAITAPDMLVLYDVSDLANPILIGRFNFPRSPAQSNTGFIGQSIFAGDRLYALEGNNGVLAFQIPKPGLSITKSGSNAVISWSAEPGWILESSLTLGPSASWTTVTQSVTGGSISVTNLTAGNAKYYRLRKP